MAKEAITKELRAAIRGAKKIVEDISKDDVNEAETRRRIEKIFETVLGYDTFKHLSSERAVRGAGETEHIDFVVQLEKGSDVSPEIIVELKRVGIDLATKHLKQVSSYAIDAGCEWILLTNTREWRIYHVEFGQPPETKLLDRWDLLKDDVNILAKKFQFISYKNVKKGALDDLWVKTKVLAPKSLLAAILTEDSIKLITKNLRKTAGVSVAPEDIVSGLRKILNESAAIAMDSVKICLPNRKPKQQRKGKPAQNKAEEKTQEKDKAEIIPFSKERGSDTSD